MGQRRFEVGPGQAFDLDFFLDAPGNFRNVAAMSDDKILTHLTASAGPGTPTIAWFCLRSQPKHEHIAAEHLRRMDGVEVFNPRIRFTRSTRLGPADVTESMFPNYVFARFDWHASLNRVHYAPGVAGVVHFGSKWPIVPDKAIEEIRALLGDSGIHVISNEVSVGDQVTVSGTVFHGLQAIVTQVMPGKQRVLVLMDFLGRQTTVQVGMDSIVRPTLRR
jgi:transcriptional antiterminator RfaH